MRVTNQLENVVQRVIDEGCLSHGANIHACRCPLCRADIAALTLTILPPRYTTGRRKSVSGPMAATASIRAAVAAASRRVAACPRHGDQSPEQEEATVQLVNYVFEEVARLVLLHGLEDRDECGCDGCTTDMMAYTLNRYPSRYGVVWRGRHNLPDYQRENLREDLDAILRWATTVVANNPVH